jgi:hypothetical protein
VEELREHIELGAVGPAGDPALLGGKADPGFARLQQEAPDAVNSALEAFFASL